jgi:hypothetical protein
MKDKAIIVISWNEKELTFLEAFDYPEQIEEAAKAFNKVFATEDESYQMTKEAFFERFLKPIKELKELAIAHEAALEFDVCPDDSKAEYLNEDIYDEPVDGLGDILNEHVGSSPRNLADSVFRIIGMF